MNQTRVLTSIFWPSPPLHSPAHPKLYHHWGWPCLRQDVVSGSEARTLGRRRPQNSPAATASGQGIEISSKSLSKGNDKPTTGTLENTELAWGVATSTPCAQVKLHGSFWPQHLLPLSFPPQLDPTQFVFDFFLKNIIL